MKELTYEFDDQYQAWNVYEWSVYERSSVLAGQTRKAFIASFDSLAELKEKYPSIPESNGYHHVSVAHLPGEDDPVAGGMYPDDWDDGY